MTDTHAVAAAGADLADLVRRIADDHGRIAITDRGRTAAVLIDPVELADIEEALAVAEYKLRKIDGSAETVPHSQVRRILGLPTM